MSLNTLNLNILTAIQKADTVVLYPKIKRLSGDGLGQTNKSEGYSKFYNWDCLFLIS